LNVDENPNPLYYLNLNFLCQKTWRINKACNKTFYSIMLSCVLCPTLFPLTTYLHTITNETIASIATLARTRKRTDVIYAVSMFVTIMKTVLALIKIWNMYYRSKILVFNKRFVKIFIMEKAN